MKKSIESTKIIFKILISVVIVVVLSYIGVKAINYFKTTDELRKESYFLQDLKLFIDSNSKDNVFTIPQIKKDIKLICFSNSMSVYELRNKFNINPNINLDIFNNYNNINKEIIRNFIEDGQYDVYIIYENGKWKGYKIGKLIFTGEVPKCFKPGDKIVKNKVYGLYTIKKRSERDLSDFI